MMLCGIVLKASFVPPTIMRPARLSASVSVNAIEKYLVPHGTAQTSHIDRYITDDDKLLLKKALIRW